MSIKFIATSLFLLPVLGFSQSTIETFSSADENAGNEFIRPEFGESLKKAQPGDVRSGKFFLRQKSEDPFNNYAVTYQLYQGLPAEKVANLKAYSLSGKSYSEVVKTKFYKTSTDEATDDIDAIFFDGSKVYVADIDSLFIKSTEGSVALSTSANALVGTGAGGLAAASDKLVEENAKHDVNVDNQVKDISNRFGNKDEIRQAAGWAIAGLSLLGGGYLAYTSYKDYQKGSDMVKATENRIAEAKDGATDVPYEQSLGKATLEKGLKDNTDYRDAAMNNTILYGILGAAGVGGGLYMVYF